MSLPSTKAELIAYTIRKMGGDYVPIEISDDQWDDIIDESIKFFSEYYYEFSRDVVITIPADSYIREVTGENLPEDGVFKYQLDSDIFSVFKMIDRNVLGTFNTVSFGEGVPENQIDFIFKLNSMSSGSMVNMMVDFQNLEMFQKLFLPRHLWTYNQNDNILYVYSHATVYAASDLMLFVNKPFTGNNIGNMWSNKELIKHVYLKGNEQFYNNMKKFNGTLPGGLELNLDAFKEEADKIDEFEENIIINYADPAITMGINMG